MIHTGILLVCVAASLTSALAQDSYGSIFGQVTDSTQAIIPSAVVRAIRTDTNQTVETKTDPSGYYALTFLSAGSYTVEAIAEGFKTLAKTNIELQTGDTLTLPLVLEIGKVNEHVSVTASADSLQTSTASRSYRWDPAKLKALPLIGRQAYSLISLTPGVIFTQEQFGTNGFFNLRGYETNSAFVINGGIQGTNQFLLNGAPVSLTGSWQYTPSMDSGAPAAAR